MRTFCRFNAPPEYESEANLRKTANIDVRGAGVLDSFSKDAQDDDMLLTCELSSVVSHARHRRFSILRSVASCPKVFHPSGPTQDSKRSSRSTQDSKRSSGSTQVSKGPSGSTDGPSGLDHLLETVFRFNSRLAKAFRCNSRLETPFQFNSRLLFRTLFNFVCFYRVQSVDAQWTLQWTLSGRYSGLYKNTQN